MLIALIFAAGVVIDFVLAVMNGSVFYLMWMWLIVPTLGVVSLSWNAAIVIAIIIGFITGKTVDEHVEPEDYFAYAGVVISRNVARCIAFVILSFGLTFII